MPQQTRSPSHTSLRAADAPGGGHAYPPECNEEDFDNLVRRMRQYRILSTLPYTKVPFWMDNVRSEFPVPASLLARLGRRVGLDDPGYLFRLLRLARRHDVVFIAGGERSNLLYLAAAGLCLWIRTPHIIVDAHWQLSPGAAGRLQRLIFRLGNRLTRQVQPHSPEEIEIYHRNFGIPRGKIFPVPFSTSLIGYDLHPTRGDFVVTGGVSYRDYATFMTAAARLPDIPVEIGLPAGYRLPSVENDAKLPHVTVHTTLTNREYLEKIAASRIMAIPITPGLERSTADQTILNAMYMRKVVVATDSIGSRIYIRHGENGFLVPEGDADAWADTLRHVYALEPREYDAIAAAAEHDARVRFGEYQRLYRTMEAGLDALGG